MPDAIIILLIIIIIIISYVCFEGAEIIRQIAGGNASTYTYYVEPSAIDINFVEDVSDIISNSAWNKIHSIKRVSDPSDAVITIRLTPRRDIGKFDMPVKYYPSGKPVSFSVTEQGTYTRPVIYIDDINWTQGVKESGLTLEEYKEYVINHEFGHGLGYNHQKCSGTDEVCPVMYQSTVGCPDGTRCGYQVDLSRDAGEYLDFRYLLT